MYESKADLIRESGVAASLSSAWECTSHKLPVQYRVDFAMLVGGSVKAWLEVKCRNRYYDEMILSAAKFTAGQQLAMATDKPFVVAFGINDQIYWRNCTGDKPEIYIGGRTDRGDSQDIEPVVMLPLQYFHTL